MLPGIEEIHALPEISEVMVSYFQLLNEILWEFHRLVHWTLFLQMLPWTQVMECLTGPPGFSSTLDDRKSSCWERTARVTPHTAQLRTPHLVPTPGAPPRCSSISPGGLWSYNLSLDFPFPGVFLGFNWLSPLWRLGSQWDANEGLCHLCPDLLECQHEAGRTNWSHRHRQWWGPLLSDAAANLIWSCLLQPHRNCHTKSRGFETSGCSQLFFQSHPSVPIPNQNNKI